MRWWSINAAKDDLTGNPISARTLLPYLIAFTLFESASLSFSFLFPSAAEPGVRDYVLGSVTVSLTCIGIYYVYRCNGGANGSLLLERLLILGWVTGVRFTVLMFFLVAIPFIFASATLPIAETIFEVLFTLTVPLYYVYLGHHVSHVAARDVVA